MKHLLLRRLVPIFLSICFISVVSLPVFAASSSSKNIVLSCDSDSLIFSDPLGQVNSFAFSTQNDGSFSISHSINGDFQILRSFKKIDDDHVLYTESVNGTTTQEVVTISNYITHTSSSISPLQTRQTYSTSTSRIFRGNIFFDPKVHNGVSYERTLAVYYEIGDSTYDGYTINGTVGQSISFLVGLVLAALGLPPDSGSWLANFLMEAFPDKLIGDTVSLAFTETVNAINNEVAIFSEDLTNGVTFEYWGSVHRVDVPGRRDEYYIHGSYLPFGNDTVARNMFLTHWPNDWTGVNYYYYAYESII